MAGTNLSRAGNYNQRVVLQAVRSHGPVTRGDVAQLTGLTHQAVINIARRLLELGLIVDEEPLQGMRGQPAARMVINPNGAYSLGLNIDREHITLVMMDLVGRVRHRVYTSQHFALPDEVLALVEAEMHSIFAQRLAPRRRLTGLGIAIPDRLSVVDVAERPEAYQAWSEIDVIETFSTRLGIPVYRENDATSAAIGELQFGLGMKHRNFVYTLISAGVGCGLIINGQPFSGGLAQAGDVGKVPIRLPDGSSQTLWSVLSSFALHAQLEERGISVSNETELQESDEAVAAVDAWIEAAVQYMFDPFLAYSYLLSPELHIIGGQLPPFAVARLCDELNKRNRNADGAVPLAPFCPSTMSVDAAAIGGAVLVLQNQLFPNPGVLLK